jgi:hypothetical protein
MEVSVIFTSPGKEPPVRIGQEVRWAPKRVWKLWRRKNLAQAVIRTQALQPVAIPTDYLVLRETRLKEYVLKFPIVDTPTLRTLKTVRGPRGIHCRLLANLYNIA